MNIWHLVIPVLIFVGGLQLLQKVPFWQEDLLQVMNQKTVSIMEKLVQTKYFRTIRLNINQDCQLGVMKKICKSKSCTVCRCNDKDIPEFWTNTEKVKTRTAGQDLWAAERQNSKEGWVWHVEDQANDKGEYFDINENIESFTNYNGSYIWKLIYEENCFKPQNNFEQMCLEQQILYNIISGLHTSISTHLSRFYKYSSSQSAWADLKAQDDKFHFNMSEYEQRVLKHPERIKNLLFIYRVLGRAIATAVPFLRHQFVIQSDDFAQDIQAQGALNQLLNELQGYDLSPQEKAALKFFTPDNPKVKYYQKYIHNISDILNCVECEKCRLFGKMQTYGVGTALKILLGYPTPYKRNQIVALFNVFNKITMSVDTYYKNRKEVIAFGYQRVSKKVKDAYTVVGGLMIIWYAWKKYQQEFMDEKDEDKIKSQ